MKIPPQFLSKADLPSRKKKRKAMAKEAADFYSSRGRFAKDPTAHRLADIGKDLALNTPGASIVQGPGAASLFQTVKEGW